MTRSAEPKTIRSVERAIDVLSELSRSAGPKTVPDLEKSLSLSRPTLYRILDTLSAKGLVTETSGPRRFRVSGKMVELARPWLGQGSLVSASRGEMDRLHMDTDETIALFVLTDELEKLCVQELPSRQALVFTRGAGFSEPVTLGSSGKAILAFMGEDDISKVLSGSDTQELRVELGRIREQGYSVSQAEIIDGAVAMAAPLIDRDNDVLGCISLFGPAVRLSGDHLDHCVGSLKQSAASISAGLGFHPAVAAE